MEYGFYHPDRGYWQAIGVSTDSITIIVEPERVEVDEEGNETVIPAVTRETTQLAELMSTYPEGTVQIPLKPGADYEWQDGEWVQVEAVLTEADLLAYAAAKRFEVETGGITVSGQTIDTSRESQSMITGAYAYSQAHPEETIRFKAASGWVTLDAATMAAIATAVGAHVQACFAAEAIVAAAIEDGTITTAAEIDAADWPG